MPLALVLGHLKRRGHHLPTSPGCSADATPASTEPSPVILRRRGSFAIKKMQLLIQSRLLGRPTYISKLTAKDQWLSTPTTYRNAPKTVFHLNFPTKGPLRYVRIRILT